MGREGAWGVGGYAGVDGHAGVGGQLSARPYSIAPTESATVACRTFTGSPPRGRESLVVSSI